MDADVSSKRLDPVEILVRFIEAANDPTHPWYQHPEAQEQAA